MYVLSFFTDSGIPKLGLEATIKIIEIPSGTILVNDSPMIELNSGFYYYNFLDYNSSKDYAILCDGSDVLSNSDRYSYSGNESFVQDITNGVFDELLSNHIVDGSVSVLVQNINKNVEDNTALILASSM